MASGCVRTVCGDEWGHNKMLEWCLHERAKLQKNVAINTKTAFHYFCVHIFLSLHPFSSATNKREVNRRNKYIPRKFKYTLISLPLRALQVFEVTNYSLFISLGAPMSIPKAFSH